MCRVQMLDIMCRSRCARRGGGRTSKNLFSNVEMFTDHHHHSGRFLVVWGSLPHVSMCRVSFLFSRMRCEVHGVHWVNQGGPITTKPEARGLQVVT